MRDPKNEPWPTAPLTRISVSRADYEAICDAIENPPPPTEELKQLMRYIERYGPNPGRSSQE